MFTLLCERQKHPINASGTRGWDACCSPSDPGVPAKLLRACHHLALSYISHWHSVTIR